MEPRLIFFLENLKNITAYFLDAYCLAFVYTFSLNWQISKIKTLQMKLLIISI